MNNERSYNALPKNYLDMLLNEYHSLEKSLAEKYDSFNVPEIDNDPLVLRIHEIWQEIESHTYQVA